MHAALQHEGGPFIIRYPRGCGEGTPWKEAPCTLLSPGKGCCLRKGSDVAILALGPAANRALEAAERYASERPWGPAVYDMRYLKPLDTEILEEVADRYRKIITVEDGAMKGGLFSAVAEFFASREEHPFIKPLGIPDEFITHDKQAAQRAYCGIDTDGIYELVEAMMQK